MGVSKRADMRSAGETVSCGTADACHAGDVGDMAPVDRAVEDIDELDRGKRPGRKVGGPRRRAMNEAAPSASPDAMAPKNDPTS